MLLTIGKEVLQTGPPPLALDAQNESRAQFPSQQRVLREILKVPPAQGTALDVYPRPQQHVYAQRLTFPAQFLAHAAQKFPVKAGGSGAGGGKAYGGDAGPFRQGIGLAGLGTQAVGAVAGADSRDVQALYGLGVPVVPAGSESGLFL